MIRTAVEPRKWLLHSHINHPPMDRDFETDGGGGSRLLLEAGGDLPPVALHAA